MMYTKNEIIKGIFGKANTLVCAVQPAPSADFVAVYWLERSDFSALDTCYYDTTCKARYFRGITDKGIKLTAGTSHKIGGLEWVQMTGNYVCDIPIQDINNIAKSEGVDGGHAIEILLADEILPKDLDEQGLDILIKARFTPNRKSSRRAQVKLWKYGNSAHFSAKLAKG